MRWTGPWFDAKTAATSTTNLEIAHSGLVLPPPEEPKMAIPNGFQKARLEIDGGDSIECAFNPESYTIQQANVWTYKPTQGRDLPDPEFGGGLPMTYKLALLLDASLASPDT